MYQATINQSWKFEVKETNQLDIVEYKDGHFHIQLPDGQTRLANLVNADYKTKTITLEINKAQYEVVLKDEFDTLIEKLGFEKKTALKLDNIKAPMPGTVLKILVTPGQALVKGEPLIILEAMKMENVLKASADVVIKKILVKEGDPVEKNKVLIEL
jgi:biotin carboxyl carrier protein